MATRRDYVVIQTALGDALFQIREMEGNTSTAQLAFWVTAETIADYLAENNKAFDRNQFIDQIIQTAAVGATVNVVEERRNP